MGLTKKPAHAARHDGARTYARELPGLLAALADPSATVRRWAARDLATHADAAPDLLRQLATEPDRSVREALLTSLVLIGNPVAVQGLIACLRSEDANLRNESVEALKSMPAALAEFMPAMLADADQDMRIFAVNILESLRHPDVEQWLINVISRDPGVNACATAVDLLSEVGTMASAQALENLKSRFPDEPYIAFAADLALKRIRED